MYASRSNFRSRTDGGRALGAVFAIGLLALTAQPGRAEAPLSAIDWLSESVAAPVAPTTPAVLPATRLPDTIVKPSAISVQPLDRIGADGLGLLPVARTGLPRDLWGPTPARDVARLIRAERPDTLPAIRSLLTTLALAELTPPPRGGDPDGAVFLARVDKLLDMGALDPALALLELPDEPSAEVFRRHFDVALLTGQEDEACAIMRESPQIAPSFPARIFCLARGGD